MRIRIQIQAFSADLGKDINRYRFLIFKFWSWIFEKSSNSLLLYAKIHLIPHCSADGCIDSFLPIGWRTFIWLKKFAKVLRNPLSAPVSETPNSSPNIKFIVHAFFGNRFVGKDGGLCTHNQPAEEVGWLEVFFVWAGSYLWTLIKNSRSKLKNQPIERNSSHADLIWPDGTFKSTGTCFWFDLKVRYFCRLNLATVRKRQVNRKRWMKGEL